jgi:flavin reductase (DIM6/NTAB) family NADH-FMN oxidoreductase RutF
MADLDKNELLELNSRYRATMINSLAGFKTAVLIGTENSQGQSNLAIFNSLIHIGANPPIYAFICRPDTVKRDTLSNILDTGYYSFNYVQSADFVKAHQTSAKYDSEISEFDAVGFEKSYLDAFPAPFIKDAVVKIAMKFIEKIDIAINGTIMVLGSVENIIFDDSLLSADGFVALEKADVLACTGLDAYYKTSFLGRLSYAKTDAEPKRID